MNVLQAAPGPEGTGPELDNRRVAAGLVDLAVLFAAGTALVLLTGGLTTATTVLALGWTLYYFFALESGAGQTLGKKLLGIRVVRADGRPAGTKEIAVRTVLRIVDGFAFYGVGLTAMLVTGKRRQRLGDLAAGTVVTAAAPAAPAAPSPPASPPAVPVETTPEPHLQPEPALDDGSPPVAAPEDHARSDVAPVPEDLGSSEPEDGDEGIDVQPVPEDVGYDETEDERLDAEPALGDRALTDGEDGEDGQDGEGREDGEDELAEPDVDESAPPAFELKSPIELVMDDDHEEPAAPDGETELPEDGRPA
jgi:uncharacterized RDD family membrane protein YckC